MRSFLFNTAAIALKTVNGVTCVDFCPLPFSTQRFSPLENGTSRTSSFFFSVFFSSSSFSPFLSPLLHCILLLLRLILKAGLHHFTEANFILPVRVTLKHVWRIFRQIRHLLLANNLQQAFRNFYKIKSSISEINLVISRTKMNQVIYSRRSTLCRLRSRNALIFSHTPRLTLATEKEGITRKGKKKCSFRG